MSRSTRVLATDPIRRLNDQTGVHGTPFFLLRRAREIPHEKRREAEAFKDLIARPSGFLARRAGARLTTTIAAPS
jgi:hypothetical protein